MRLVEGFATAITEVCAMTIIMRVFPLDELAGAYGALTMARTCASLAGHPAGGALYEAGGFVLPFLAGGVAITGAYIAARCGLAHERILAREV